VSDAMILTTERLTLRPWDERDIDILAEIANDRNIWRNVRDGFPHPYTRKAAENWVKTSQVLPEPKPFAIEYQERLIGGIGLHPFDDVHRYSAELGYWIGAAYWGKGLATEAVRRIVEHGFQTLNLERIQASTYSWNEASARVLLKAGFKCEGRMRNHAFKDGQLIDVLLYARLRTDHP
jgi:[ribosomal protein S5]-alanine N-acetyltransferase